MADIHDMPCGKMSPEHTPPTVEKISAVSSKNCAKSKMNPYLFLDLRNGKKQDASWEKISPSAGGHSMPNTSESHSGAEDVTLSSILMANVHPKYYLSSKAALGILRRASERGKELPAVLKLALERQAGLTSS